MHVVAISDTHGRHGRLAIPRCDLLVHAGDATARGGWSEMESFLGWLGEQPAAHKVLIAGNHDLCCETMPQRVRAAAKAAGVHYLCDEGLELDGRRIWGSPMTPRFRNMAFNRVRGDEIATHWAKIPDDLDLLVTHGPPHGIGDRVILGMRVGCQDLGARVREVLPRVHLFGHIHEAAGTYRVDGLRTRFLNVASSKLIGRRPRPPVAFAL